MNKTTIKQEIIKFCEGKGGFIFGGQIEDYIRNLYGAKASNASRRCRELVKSGILEKSLIQIDGKGPRVVRYRINELRNHFEEENRCGKPHNNGAGEESCLECGVIKLNL